MRKIVFTNHKGGCGKSTSALCVAQGLKQLGYKVLVIDLDPQHNLTSAVIPQRLTTGTVSDMLLGKVEPSVINSEQGFDLIPSGKNMGRNELDIQKEMQYETILQRMLEDMDTSKYDYCIIDSPPNMGTYTIIALMVADVFYIPVQPEFFGIHGMTDILEYTQRIKKFNKGLTFGGIFITRTHPNDRKRLVQSVITQLKKAYPNDFMNVFIRDSVSVPESQAKRTSLFEYDEDSNAAKDYKVLVSKILEPVTV